MLTQAKKVLEIEVQAIRGLIPRLGRNFQQAVDLIAACSGKVIVIGMGKSGLVGRKIAATFSSTGTPAMFLHAAEGILGDVGMITGDDVVLALSYSGETEEIKKIVPSLKRMGVKIVSFTGKTTSPLAKQSDVVIDVSVSREACPYNLIPTASTTAMLALGDALAVCLLKKKNFKKKDFAMLHPGGILGKKLLLKVSDLMHKGKENPIIQQNRTVKDALLVMTSKKLGAVSIVDKKGKLVGFFTDGDLRRKLQQDKNLLTKSICEVMTQHPTIISPNALAVEAARILKQRRFDNLPVVDKTGRPVGVIDEGDLLKEGIA